VNLLSLSSERREDEDFPEMRGDLRAAGNASATGAAGPSSTGTLAEAIVYAGSCSEVCRAFKRVKTNKTGLVNKFSYINA